MHKKYSLLILAFAFMFGTIVASLPPVKASIGPGQVRFYVWTGTTNIIAVKTVGTTFAVEVWIESPLEWRNTPQGIVGYTASVKVDPQVLEVLRATKIPIYGGFLEQFLLEYYPPWAETQFLPPSIVDNVNGLILGFAEYIVGFETLGVGAGGGPYKLMRFAFKSLSETAPSIIDILDQDDCARLGVDLKYAAYYTTTDGVKHPVDIVDDGYYIGFEVSEFPLGIGLTMMLAPIAPLAYLWRTHKKETKNENRKPSSRCYAGA